MRAAALATALLSSATGAPAPFPSEAFGVPIIVSDGVSDVETLVS